MRKLFVNIVLIAIGLVVFNSCEQKPDSGVEPPKPDVEDQEPEIDTGIGIENGHEYIDLGLSVKWATCNVGAETPEDYGDYFAWAETQSKSKYNWNSYKYHKNTTSTGFLTKYCTSEPTDGYKWGYNDFSDGKSILERVDDAAYVNWSGKWRTPTLEEFNELINFCKWEKTIQNRVVGYKVTSIVEGYTERSIFLPAAGDIWTDPEGKETEHEGRTIIGKYWSNELEFDHCIYAYYLRFSVDDADIDIYSGSRCTGFPIRPVCP